MSSSQQTCCDRSGSNKLNSLDEVLERLRSLSSPISETVELPLTKAFNQVLAEDIVSEINVPPSDNSAVDGYAINLDDYYANKDYEISQRIPAGTEPTRLEAGTIARIFTGASIPCGANAVIMQEDAIVNKENGSVRFEVELKAQQNIRPCGQDIENGSIVLKKGQLLNPQRIGLLASIGVVNVHTIRPLKVAILSTGDELVEPGEQAGPGQIYNSNRYLLTSMLNSLGFEIIDLGVVKDQLQATLEALNEASRQADVVITTGGASVGEEDYIQTAIKQTGTIDFWKVAIKPGKPFMYGEIDNTPILGLPGNPGAVFVTFSVLARHFLLHKQGLSNIEPAKQKRELGFSIKKAGIRREFLRVKLNEEQRLIKHTNQSSGMLSSASWADGLAIIPEHTQPLAGDLIDFIPFHAIFNRYD